MPTKRISLGDAVKQAISRHQSGQVEEAVAAYKQILEQQPTCADALHYLGLAAHQQGNAQQAVDLLQRSVALQPDRAHYHNNFGKVLAALRRYADAEAACRKALELESDYTEAWHNLALCCNAQGKRTDAESACRKALELKSDYPECLCSLGLILAQRNKLDQAIGCFQKAIALKADFAEAHSQLSNAYGRQGRHDQALAAAQKAILLKPDLAEAYNNAGSALGNMGKHKQSIEHCQKAVRLSPNLLAGYVNLGNSHLELGQFEPAISAYQRAIQLKGGDAQLYASLALALCRQNRLEEALTAAKKSIELDPKSPRAYTHLGIVLQAQAKIPESIEAYAQAIELKPDYAGAYWNKSLALLLTGDFAQGWSEYEWRWHCPSLAVTRRNFHQSRWHGEDLKGKTILLHAEQGFGDTFQFVRYAAILAAQGAKVLVEVQPPLANVLAGVEGISQLIPRGAPLPAFDYHCPLLSLPLVLGTTLETIPARVPYIKPDAKLIEEWGAKLKDDPAKLKVGLVWAGRAEHKNDTNRSCALRSLAPLARVPGVSFYSLQKGLAASEMVTSPAGMKLVDMVQGLKGFADAGLIHHLDLIIGVDTAVVHLAGAMNKPVWVMLPFSPDWRWMLDREDSPWYPSMRLFRQSGPGVWEDVVERIGEALRKLA